MGLMEIRRRMLADNASHEIPEWVSEGPDDVVSFESDWAVPMKSLKVAINPVQDLSHGDPSPDNICPISGWTGVNVQRTRINIFDKTAAVQDAFVSDTDGIETVRTESVCSGYISVVPNTTYYIKSDQTAGAWGAWYDENKTYISGITGYMASAQDSAKTKTAPSNARYMRLTVAYNGTGNPDTFSVNYPSTDHDYHAYTGNAYNISWETEAGTVYGGTLDVVSGELVVDKASVDLGTLSWNITTSYPHPVFYTTLENKKNSAQFLCSIFEFTGNFAGVSSFLNAGGNSTLGSCYANKQIYVREDSCGSISAFVDFVRNQHIVYELATPQTYHLTPTEVRTLLGQNNVFADTGQSEVQYWVRNS